MLTNAHRRACRTITAAFWILVSVLGVTVPDTALSQLQQLQDTTQLLAALEPESAGDQKGKTQAGIVFGQDDQQLFVITVASADTARSHRPPHFRVYLRGLPEVALQGEVVAKIGALPTMAIVRIKKSGHHQALNGLCLKFSRLIEDSSVIERGMPVLAIGHVGAYRWIIPVQPDAVLVADEDEIVFQSHVVGDGHIGGALLDESGHILGLIHRQNGPLAFAIRIEKVVAQLSARSVATDLRPSRYSTQSPLLAASEAWDVEEITRLVEECYDVNAEDKDGSTPLDYAVGEGDESIAKLLLEHGADPNTVDNRCRIALSKAVDQDDVEMVQLLLSHGANPTWKDNCTGALREAVFNSNEKMLQLIIAAYPKEEGGYDRHAQRDYFLAVRRGWMEGVSAFLKSGIPVDLKNEYNGRSALHEAVEEGYSPIVYHLLDNGASVTIADKEGATALHAAASGSAAKHAEIMDRLIAAGADLNARDKWGGTPLHKALHFGEEVLAAKLFEACADPYVKDNEGQIPMELASEDDLRKLFTHMLENGEFDKNQTCAAHLRLTLDTPK